MDSRVRVSVEAVGQVDSLPVELEPGQGALLGRAPEIAAATEPGIAVERQVIAVPAVSANHALVWVRDDRLHVRDLGSRNGTWVRVPPHGTVELAAGDAQLRLAAAARGSDAEDLPEPARYRNATDFGEAIARAVREWFQRHHMPAQIRLA
ncbi:MAG TPA: FHA domain-containing protein, partial [Kofleriaceae bacterium]|nr:FHA domain-containing protein [Kofleriaceae bacterium]